MDERQEIIDFHMVTAKHLELLAVKSENEGLLVQALIMTHRLLATRLNDIEAIDLKERANHPKFKFDPDWTGP